ncbi:hypothetical protein A3K62_00235 [Candidatus Pacearchaeota archaeon RBG_16_35_8]|nr:MAG: hypothetical protein A3K62_00235 [Candidatus Pacearchaeota archaeon RBG_16_35_8]
MAVETVLQHWILTNFVYPFLLVFFIVFAVLEKTKVLGEDTRQLNAMVAFVIGLIFVGAIYPKIVVGNLILFLTVSLIVVFVFLLLWGFVMGEGIKMDSNPVKYASGALIFIAVAAAVLWTTGAWDNVYSFLFQRNWSKEFWTNVIFILVIVGALGAVIKTAKGK